VCTKHSASCRPNLIEEGPSDEANVFRVDPTSLSLKPGQAQPVRVTVVATRPREHEAYIQGRQTFSAHSSHISVTLLELPACLKETKEPDLDASESHMPGKRPGSSSVGSLACLSLNAVATPHHKPSEGSLTDDAGIRKTREELGLQLQTASPHARHAEQPQAHISFDDLPEAASPCQTAANHRMLPASVSEAHEAEPQLPRIAVHMKGAFHPNAGPPATTMALLHIALCATCQPSRLELHDPETLVWTLHRPHASSHVRYKKSTTLCNVCRFSLAFRLITEGPFKIVDAVPSVVQDPGQFSGMKIAEAATSDSYTTKRLIQERLFYLPPNESLDVSMQCIPAKSAPFKDYTRQGALRVTYLNGESQSFPLQAAMKHPALTMTLMTGEQVNLLDCGHVHVQSCKAMDVFLTNVTNVDAEWHLEQVPLACSTDEAGTHQLHNKGHKTARYVETCPFTFSPREGIIRGATLVQPAVQRVKVVFAPTRAEHYRSKAIVAIKSGEACTFEIRGVGSLDEGDEFAGHLATLYQ
jgi:hypothetical protein